MSETDKGEFNKSKINAFLKETIIDLNTYLAKTTRSLKSSFNKLSGSFNKLNNPVNSFSEMPLSEEPLSGKPLAVNHAVTDNSPVTNTNNATITNNSPDDYDNIVYHGEDEFLPNHDHHRSDHDEIPLFLRSYYSLNHNPDIRVSVNELINKDNIIGKTTPVDYKLWFSVVNPDSAGFEFNPSSKNSDESLSSLNNNYLNNYLSNFSNSFNRFFKKSFNFLLGLSLGAFLSYSIMTVNSMTTNNNSMSSFINNRSAKARKSLESIISSTHKRIIDDLVITSDDYKTDFEFDYGLKNKLSDDNGLNKPINEISSSFSTAFLDSLTSENYRSLVEKSGLSKPSSFFVVVKTYDQPDPRTIPKNIDYDSLFAGNNYFVEIDKEEQVLRVWEKAKLRIVAETPISTGKNKGDKRKRGDFRTPEGFFTIVSKERSDYWLHNNERGEYGPLFFRLNKGSWDRNGFHNPDAKCSIGIHGTNNIYDLGSRASEGCIRVPNEFLLYAADKGFLKKGLNGFISHDLIDSVGDCDVYARRK